MHEKTRYFEVFGPEGKRLPQKNSKDEWRKRFWILEWQKKYQKKNTFQYLFLRTMSWATTVAKCLKTVFEARTAQEPSTTCSDDLGSRKFSVRERTHFEIMDGHLSIILSRDFPASLSTMPKFKLVIMKP